MRGPYPFLLAMLLALAPLPAGAVAAAQSGAAGLADILADLEADRYEEALAGIERLLARRPPPAELAELETMRGSLLLMMGRGDEGRQAFARAEAVNPGDPGIALYHLALAFDLAAIDLILPAIDHMIARFPDSARAIDPLRVTPVIGWLRRNERAAEADDLLIRLGLVGFGGSDLTARDNYAMEGAAAALKAGRIDDARALAARVNSRRELTMALTERRFEPLWPAIEARVGPHMAAAEAAFVADAEALRAAHPDDPAALRSLIEAYRLAGKLEEADRLGAAFAVSPEAVRQIDEIGGWVINDHAGVLEALDLPNEADARLAALASLDIETAPWLISMRINRLLLNVRESAWERAAALQAEAAAAAERHGSPYARQLVRRAKLCTLHALDREAERDAALAELRAHEADTPEVTIEGLFCVGRLDEAEAVLLRWFARAEDEYGPVAALQPPAQPGGELSVSDRGWQALLQRPAVRRAFDRVGRILPESFRRRPAQER